MQPSCPGSIPWACGARTIDDRLGRRCWRQGPAGTAANTAMAMDGSGSGSGDGRGARATAHELARYEALFASRTRGMKSSAMREMMALTERPEVISLAG